MGLPELLVDARADRAQMLEQARKASELLKSLAHESRLLILCHLTQGEKTVTELEELLDQPQAAVSQQLARLRFDRLVTTRRDGRNIYYSIATREVMKAVDIWQKGVARDLAEKVGTVLQEKAPKVEMPAAEEKPQQ